MSCARFCVCNDQALIFNWLVVLLILEYFTQKVNIIISKFCAIHILNIGGEELLYDNVKRICKEKGIPISRLEEELEFPRSYICKWNDNEPGIRKVQKVADYLGVPIEKLLE